MKKTSLILAVAIASACSGGVGNPSVEDTLRQAAESGTPLFGHQDDLMYGHTWNATKDNDTDLTRSDVLSVAGSYPYILGLDLGGLEIDSPVNLDGNDFNIMREAAIKHHERGGIVTLSWHLRNPLTGGDSWDVSNAKVVESILPGGELHEKFIGWLDRISDYIASFKDGNGRQIPVIWRPWHEHTGGWFWWGAANCTVNQYNDLWKMTYNHMVNEKKLEGLLWAISPNSLPADFEIWESRYPGDEYIGDVMNVLFSSGWIEDPDGKVFIYYASSDTRMHVATSSIERLVDYCMNTEPDGLRTGLTVERINRLIDLNEKKHTL